MAISKKIGVAFRVREVSKKIQKKLRCPYGREKSGKFSDAKFANPDSRHRIRDTEYTTKLSGITIHDTGVVYWKIQILFLEFV